MGVTRRGDCVRISILVFFFLLLSLFLILTSMFTDFTSKYSAKMEYQYFEFSPSTNSTRNGVIRISEALEMKNEGYISYSTSVQDDSIDSLVVVKNFGGREYNCYGNCYCSDDYSRKRRSSFVGSSVMKRGVYIVVSAFSTIMATTIAEDFFEDQCSTSMDECEDPSSNILSAVEYCEEAGPAMEYVAKSGGRGMKKKIIRTESYMCEGHCVENYIKIHNSFTERCRKKFKNKCLDIDSESQIQYYPDKSEKPSGFPSPEVQFAEEVLINLCLENSRLHVYQKDDLKLKAISRELAGEDPKKIKTLTGFALRSYKKSKSKGFSCCHGISQSEKNGGPYDRDRAKFKNIKCRRIDGPKN